MQSSVGRWEKVKLLTLPSSWYDRQRYVLFQMVDVTSAPELTMQQVKSACKDAVQREEWELAREFLKCYCTETAKGEASMLEPIQTELAQHDEKANAMLQREQKDKDQTNAREEWLTTIWDCSCTQYMLLWIWCQL